MAEFEEGSILLESSNSFESKMEFINSQLIKKDGGDHVHHHHAYDHHDHVMGSFSGDGSNMTPTVNFTDHLHQMSLYQSDHHDLSAASEPTVHFLGFGGADLTSKKDTSAMPMSSSQHLFNFSSPSSNNKMNLGGKKRKRNNNVVEKPKEVVHVRAKRGQATDSHSLAERVRREKINKRLKHLQDLVPGCYKTMGMAVMLDVVINYVGSLQNQIEFLSMKLSAASMYNDLNFLEMAVDTIQSTDHQGTEPYEAWAKW